MTLAEQLKEKQKQKVLDYAAEYAEEIKDTLIQSAEKGFTGWRTSVEKGDKQFHLFTQELFRDELAKRLGMEVELQKEFRESLLWHGRGTYEYHLRISWS